MLNNIETYRSVLNLLPVPVFIKDANHRFIFVNKLMCAYFDKPAEEILGKSDYDFFPAEQSDVFCEIDNQVLFTGESNENEEVITDQRGMTHTIVTRKSMIAVGEERYVLVTINDITELRESEARTRYLAYHDLLTGLPNRTMLYEQLNQSLAQATANTIPIALLLIDLDGFKSVNDSYGHKTGDELLRAFAHRLKAVVHDQDLVGRMGGDEFAVIVHAASWRDNLEPLCAAIVEAASEPFNVEGVVALVRASVGVFRLSTPDISTSEVIRKADTALYEAKRQGKGRYCIYSPLLDSGLMRRHEIESELRQAIILETGIHCVYQPLVRSKDEVIVGVEALVRWDHASLGTMLPSQFVPVAEEVGLIGQLGKWVLRRACQDIRAWSNLFLAVNVSPIQLRDENFATSVLNILEEERFPPSRLELELTESAIVNFDDASTAQLKVLRAAGARISVDDFGTGYSSIRLLKELELDKIKIDRSFVSFVTKEKDSAAIVEAIARLSAHLGLDVVAEGVEMEEQKNFLREVGCTSMQGFLFSKPLNTTSLAALLSTSKAAAGA